MDIFFDSSAANNGDGTSPSPAAGAGLTGAYNTFVGVAPAPGDTWWVRRRADIYAMTTNNLTLNVAEFAIIGWPLSGDSAYSVRPAAAQPLWDADVEEEVLITFTTGQLALSSAKTRLARLTINSLDIATNPVHITDTSEDGYFENIKVYGLAGNTAAVCILEGDGHVVKGLYVEGQAEPSDILTWAALTSKGQDITIQSGTVDNGGRAFHVTGSDNIFVGVDITFDNAAVAVDRVGVDIAGDRNAIYDLAYRDNATGVATGNIKNFLITGDFNTLVGDFENKGPRSYKALGAGGHSNVRNINSATPVDVGADNVFIGKNINVVAGTGMNVLLGATVVLNNFTGFVTNAYVFFGEGHSIVYSLNHAGVAGDWRSDASNGNIISDTNVVRAGSTSNYSLKIEKTSASNPGTPFPVLGVPDKAEILFLDLPVGTHTIKMYGAHKGFPNDFLSYNDMLLAVEYVDINGVKRLAHSAIGLQALDSDASDWSNVVDEVPFCLSTSLTVNYAQRVAVRIRGYYKYEAGALVYIDPVPVIT